jgi:hypothetical protein
VGAEPPNGGAGDADREGPNDDGYMAADPVKAMRYFADYFVTIEGGKAVVGIYARGRDGTEELKCETVGAMRAIFANWVIEGKPVFDMWFKSRERRTYLGFVFVPGAQRVVGRSLNLFTGFGCEPARGNCDLYWNHVRDVICGGVDEYFLYLQRWLAHMFQRPEELPEKAVVLLSKKEGVGKGTFIDPLAFLLRRHYITLTQSKHVTGPFNSHLRDKLLVFVNEALWTAGEPGIGILKSMITDRQTTHEGKGANASEGTNYARFVFASNWDLPVRIGPHDRRFLVLRVSDAHVGDHAYFEALRRQLDNGGRAALLYDLLNLDLADFNPRVSPKTQEGFTMKLRSAEASVRWWFDCLKAGAIAGIDDRWPATVGAAALYESYVRWCEGQGLRSQAPNVFGRELANMLAGTAFSPTRPGSAGNRTRGYALPTLPAARQAFERSVSEGPEIWNL